jgi:phosphoenolpyruvate-protein phosphotransferase (PTS system enzyme I)
VTRSSHPPSGDARAPVVLQGIAGAPGVVVATVTILDDRRTTFQRRRLRASEVTSEMARVDAAIERAQTSLVEISERVSMRPLGESRAILDAYLAMVRDPMLHDRIEEGIRRDRLCAEWAIASAADSIVLAFTEGLREFRDPYIEERKHDVEFVADKLLHALSGEDGPAIRIEHPSIIVARDLSPADTAVMGRMPVLGFVTERGSSTSHTSIMARALHIPAVVGLGAHELTALRSGDTVVLDGNRGVVVLYPDPTMVKDAQARAKKQSALAKKLRGGSGPSRSNCGTPLLFKANIELPEEVEAVVAMNADGIGLYRTEFMYINRKEPPSEDEQFAILQRVVRDLDGRPVTLRTFDLGGDKFASSFALPDELNPALGLRAVRLALQVPDVLLAQLRAMVRASREGPVRIMVPMVTTLLELRAVRALLMQACEQVGLPPPPLGMMVEVPAAALLADMFAKNADFFSIGTNDLVQYALAVDRTSRSVANLASPLDPSVLRLIDMVIRAAQTEGITVGLCGQMAQDPLASALLLGMGLRRFSIGGPALALVREALSRVTIAECEEAANEVRTCIERSEVQKVLTRRFESRFVDLYNT